MSSVVEAAATSFDDATRELLTESDETATQYLREKWLADAIGALRAARRKAGLTQESVAAKLGTQQPNIQRLERDSEGRITLHRFIDFALACGLVPMEIVLQPVEEALTFIRERPSAPRTEALYGAWLHKQHSTTEATVTKEVSNWVVPEGFGINLTPPDFQPQTGVVIGAPPASSLASHLGQVPITFGMLVGAWEPSTYTPGGTLNLDSPMHFGMNEVVLGSLGQSTNLAGSWLSVRDYAAQLLGPARQGTAQSGMPKGGVVKDAYQRQVA